MASARDIVRRLIENIDDPEDLDSPESFDVAGHMDSPVARLASTNGFTRDDRNESEERWVKKLSNGQEAWLRTTSSREWEHPMDMRDPSRHGGREWEFLVVKPQFKCDYCNQDRPAKKGTCPHCKKTDKIIRWNSHDQIARANEVVMSYLLGAILQRLATWNPRVPKPRLEALGVEDPDDPEQFVKDYANRKWEPRPIPPPNECPKFALFARLETTDDSATKDMLKAGQRLNDLPRYKDVVLYSDRKAKNFVARIPWHHSGKPVSRSKWVTINGCRRPLFWIPA